MFTDLRKKAAQCGIKKGGLRLGCNRVRRIDDETVNPVVIADVARRQMQSVFAASRGNQGIAERYFPFRIARDGSRVPRAIAYKTPLTLCLYALDAPHEQTNNTFNNRTLFTHSRPTR